MLYLHYYIDLEDGHTLHLVARQPVQAQTQPGTVSGDPSRVNDNQGMKYFVSLRIVGLANQVSPGGETEGPRNVNGRNQIGNQAQPAVTVVNQPFQVQLASPGSVPRNMVELLFYLSSLVVPDSMTTLLDFINRMELILQHGGDFLLSSFLTLWKFMTVINISIH
ncbi:hypothetical protein BHM03_00014475 [Ensete ventricosum]|uniref:Uncharacterized protein n=1 Tax=Ensete ventricosum TaxID=4639 RepID=A0A427A8I4_ENSVE|nr:hypothetical protein B296_00034487 [Ensete ventricosum]RZR72541.1 hypothetical protein BHM03_00014475 [Ensete ventricosum]